MPPPPCTCPGAQVEQWLTEILEAWRSHLKGPAVEPWDYWYSAAAASRQLLPAIPREAILPISERFYRDLGADLEGLGVIHDLGVRPGKAPLAYTDQVRIARRAHGAWRPAVPRVSANYEQGGLSVLNELIHEDGHAVHEAALRTRPAFYSLDGDLFGEAFADVPAWSSFEPRMAAQISRPFGAGGGIARGAVLESSCWTSPGVCSRSRC